MRKSHLTRGAWIEIFFSGFGVGGSAGRTSHEVRGLKSCLHLRCCLKIRSHLTRGAWIEMALWELDGVGNISRTSHEVRGLKY